MKPHAESNGSARWDLEAKSARHRTGRILCLLRGIDARHDFGDIPRLRWRTFGRCGRVIGDEAGVVDHRVRLASLELHAGATQLFDHILKFMTRISGHLIRSDGTVRHGLTIETVGVCRRGCRDAAQTRQAEQMIEGAVFQHQDKDVLDRRQV